MDTTIEAKPLHAGEFIKRRCDASGIAKTRIAKRMSYSRPHLYELFKMPTFSDEVFKRASKALNRDILREWHQANVDGQDNFCNDEP